jgi:hypothetical protein
LRPPHLPERWPRLCHVYEGGLISGQVTFDLEPLDPPAGGNLLICCAKPQGGSGDRPMAGGSRISCLSAPTGNGLYTVLATVFTQLALPNQSSP